MNPAPHIDWRMIAPGLFRGMWCYRNINFSATLIGLRLEVIIWRKDSDSIQSLETSFFHNDIVTFKEFQFFVSERLNHYFAKCRKKCNDDGEFSA